MAKWGEGDPRWIVEERPDATNVNNWHWTEKNASSWSIDKLKKLFKEIPIKNNSAADLIITEVENCEGEASANNRKGKLIFFYEWDLTIKWTGKLKDDDTVYSGKIKIPNLSEENDVSEVDIKISVEKENDDSSEKLKGIMEKSSKDVIRQQLTNYLSSLKEEFSKGMILPKKDEVKPDQVKILSSGFNKKINVTTPLNDEKKELNKKTVDVTTINLKEKFQCKANEFYDALTKIEMVTAFTRGHVKINPIKGGKFELFNGNIYGEFVELSPPNKIVQQWRYKQWPNGHFSTVTFFINEKSDHTEVKVTQTGVPSAEVDVTKENWQRYYWDSMKRTFGFGSFIV